MYRCPGFVPMASVTVVVLSVVTRLPFVSSTLTVTAGLIVAPPTALVGCCKNANVAAPAEKVILPLVTAVRTSPPEAVAVGSLHPILE